MAKMVAEYSSFQTDTGFLRFKQDYLSDKAWLTAFYVHVFTAVLCLLAGFTQFSKLILKQNKKMHRMMGRFYAYNILFINFPAGMIMAFYANGHLPSKLAFIILDCLWFLFTVKAVLFARQKNFTAHREYMIRSYALTLSAIALRSWKIVLVNLTALDVQTIYMIDAWLGFVPNLLLAEWLIRKRRSKAVFKKISTAQT
jgi:uncharacterized membrane protein